MAEKKIPDLFPDTKEPVDTFEGAPGQKVQISGVLPGQMIRQMIENGEIWSQGDINDDQIQPASLDLRLADTAYRIRASFFTFWGLCKQKA